VKKAWKPFHFTTCILKKGNTNTSLVRPILVYESSCWDSYRKGEKNVLDWVQNKAAKFAHQRNDLNWESLAQSRKMARICAFFKAYTGDRAWKAISDRQQKPCYLSRVIMIGKLEAENKRQMLVNITL
jgi:hypothetical protein